MAAWVRQEEKHMEERMMDVIVEIYNHMDDSDKDAFTLEDAEDMVHGCRTRNRVVHQERTLKKGRAPSGAFARSGGFFWCGNTHKSDKKRCV